jgi:hypothetical protein
MAKREKFSIWGREPDTKKGCYKFYQDKKKTWPIGHVLNEEDKKYMLEMMNKNYYSPLKPEMVQDVFHNVKDKIIEIKIGTHPVFGEKLIEFWTKKPTYSQHKTLRMLNGELSSTNEDGSSYTELMEDIGSGKMYDFSVRRCICFGGNGMQNESDPPRKAVLEALHSTFVEDKIGWKKSQGYRPGIDEMKHAHHVDGKEVKTIVIKFLNAIKKPEEEFVNLIYPEHGNFETNHIYYEGGMGWKFKDTEVGLKVKNAFSRFHYRNREYELVDPIHHQNITSEEIKFNTSIRNEFKEKITDEL